MKVHWDPSHETPETPNQDTHFPCIRAGGGWPRMSKEICMTKNSNFKHRVRHLAELKAMPYTDALKLLNEVANDPRITPRQSPVGGDNMTARPADGLIVEELMKQAPERSLTYQYSDGSEVDLSVVIHQADGRFQVWWKDSANPGITLESIAGSMIDAKGDADQIESEFFEGAQRQDDEMQDAEWEARDIPTKEWEWPMTFSDATDYLGGWELQDEDDVIAFFERRRLFDEDEAGNAYWWDLVDGNGDACRPVRTHRGEYHLESGNNQ